MTHTTTPTIQRPPLTGTTTTQQFRDFYWLKAELVTFCREHALSTQGDKVDIANRIALFLETGQRETPITTSPKRVVTDEPLTLDTLIHEGFVCTQRHRAFFKRVIGPRFHFSTFIQNYFKANTGKTYRDVVAVWHIEEARKNSAAIPDPIAAQFEYNRFTRDFFNDTQNAGKTRRDAIAAWHAHRNTPKSQL